MKKKNIFLMCILCCMTILFSGCPDNKVSFADSMDKNKIVAGETEPIRLTFSPPTGYAYYRVFLEVNGKIVNAYTAPCENIPTSSPKVSFYDLEGTNAGDKLKLKVTLYGDSRCVSTRTYEGISVSSNIYTVVENEILASQDNTVLEALGNDKTQICKSGFLDANNNETDIGTDNLFVRIAYSQIGYKEKRGGSTNTNSCTADSGKGDYQKYGPNGQQWCNYFVHWCLKKAGIVSPFANDANTKTINNWAKNNSKSYTKASSRKTGDLVIFNSETHIGIVYQQGSDWYVIHGNWTRTSAGNNYTGVHISPLGSSTYNTDDITGYVSMEGIAY